METRVILHILRIVGIACSHATNPLAYDKDGLDSTADILTIFVVTHLHYTRGNATANSPSMQQHDIASTNRYGKTTLLRSGIG
jgi:hypothetical protein